MWVASKYGFFSIVLKGGFYHVRARERSDLLQIVKAASIHAVEGKNLFFTPEADYCCRLVFKRGTRRGGDDYRAVMQALTESVDYDNFKCYINNDKSQRDKSAAYAEMWQTMFMYQARKLGKKLRGYWF